MRRSTDVKGYATGPIRILQGGGGGAKAKVVVAVARSDHDFFSVDLKTLPVFVPSAADWLTGHAVV